MKLDDEDLVDAIKKQNRIDGNTRTFHLRLKRIIKEKSTKEEKGDSSIIIEVDTCMYYMLRREKINIGWKKCLIFNYVNVKRCFNCWDYYYITKNCKRA